MRHIPPAPVCLDSSFFSGRSLCPSWVSSSWMKQMRPSCCSVSASELNLLVFSFTQLSGHLQFKLFSAAERMHAFSRFLNVGFHRHRGLRQELRFWERLVFRSISQGFLPICQVSQFFKVLRSCPHYWAWCATSSVRPRRFDTWPSSQWSKVQKSLTCWLLQVLSFSYEAHFFETL